MNNFKKIFGLLLLCLAVSSADAMFKRKGGAGRGRGKTTAADTGEELKPVVKKDDKKSDNPTSKKNPLDDLTGGDEDAGLFGSPKLDKKTESKKDDKKKKPTKKLSESSDLSDDSSDESSSSSESEADDILDSGKEDKKDAKSDDSSDKDKTVVKPDWRLKVDSVVKTAKDHKYATGGLGAVAVAGTIYAFNEKVRKTCNAYVSKTYNAVKDTVNNYVVKPVKSTNRYVLGTLATLGTFGVGALSYFGYKKADEKYKVKEKAKKAINDAREYLKTHGYPKLVGLAKDRKIQIGSGLVLVAGATGSYFLLKKRNNVVDRKKLLLADLEKELLDELGKDQQEEITLSKNTEEDQLDKDFDGEKDDILSDEGTSSDSKSDSKKEEIKTDDMSSGELLGCLINSLDDEQWKIEGVTDFFAECYDNPLLLDESSVSTDRKAFFQEFISKLNEVQISLVKQIVAKFKEEIKDSK